jgi:hypothetical protein
MDATHMFCVDQCTTLLAVHSIWLQHHVDSLNCSLCLVRSTKGISRQLANGSHHHDTFSSLVGHVHGHLMCHGYVLRD